MVENCVEGRDDVLHILYAYKTKLDLNYKNLETIKIITI